MAERHRAGPQKAAAALVVLLLHAAMFRLLLASHLVFEPPAQKPNAVTWILLPLEPDLPPPLGPDFSVFSPLFAAPIVPELEFALPPLPNAITLQSLPRAEPKQKKKVLLSIGRALACDFVHYEVLTVAEKTRCAKLIARDVEAARPFVLTSDEAADRAEWQQAVLEREVPDVVSSADPRFIMTCSWEHGVCMPKKSQILGCALTDESAFIPTAKRISLTENLKLTVGFQMDSAGCAANFNIGLNFDW